MSNTDCAELDALVPAAACGDRHAVSQLLAIIRPPVTRYCRARVGRTAAGFSDADQVAQQVCLAVLAQLPGYQDQARSLAALVYHTAAAKLADARGTSACHRREPVGRPGDTTDFIASPRQHQHPVRELGRLLATLPDAQREILLLRVACGLSAAQTGRIVGSTTSAVRSTQHRGLSRLRQLVTAAPRPPSVVLTSGQHGGSGARGGLAPAPARDTARRLPAPRSFAGPLGRARTVQGPAPLARGPMGNGMPRDWERQRAPATSEGEVPPLFRRLRYLWCSVGAR